MDFIGAKVLFTIILVILIVFAGAVPPAYKQFLDTWYGRLAAAVAVLTIARLGGWYIGVAAAAAVLVLMPTNMREGFICKAAVVHGPSGDEGFVGNQKSGFRGGEGGSRGGVLETAYDKQYFTNYDKKTKEAFTEGFAGADKKQTVPVERRGRWFIEEVLDEHPEEIETDTVETSAGQ